MNIRCAFGWHRWKDLWRVFPGRYYSGSYFIINNSFHIGRICADCRKRELDSTKYYRGIR